MNFNAKRLLCGVLTAAMVSTSAAANPVYAAVGQAGEPVKTGWNVWVQNSAERAFASSQMPETAKQSISLYAARNEYEASQVLVRSEEWIHDLSLQVTDLVGEGGTKISASNIVIYSEYSAPAVVPGDVEPAPDGSNMYTDALLPASTMNVEPNVTQPYWIRVYVPKGQEAGSYKGTVTVTSAEGSFEVPLSVKVYDVTIPDTDESSFKMINWFSNAGTDFGVLEASIMNQYDVEMYDENWWEVIENIARDLAIHRNNVIFMDAEALLLNKSIEVDESDSEAVQRQEYVTGEDGKMLAGRYLFDWNNYDRMVDLFIDAGALQYIYLSGNRKVMKQTGNKMMLYVMEEKNGAMTRVLKPIYTDQANGAVNPEAQEYMETLYKALRCHMRERYPQLLDKLYVSALDEPFTVEENMASNWFYDTVKSVYPEALSNEAHCRFTMEMTESTTLCPVLDLYEAYQSYYQKMKTEGKELWYYTCIGPQGDYLNRFIPYHLIKTRLIPWYAYKIGAEGYLHWGYSYWGNNDTFNSVQTGDEWLVRPDVDNYDVYTSVRNEAQLDGLEDYELLKLLASINQDAAEHYVNTMVQTATSYAKDGAAITSAHKAILDLLTGEKEEPIAIAVFQDPFENGYDYAWNRQAVANTSWSVEQGRYLYYGAGTQQTGMTTLRNQTIKNGKIVVTLKLGDVYNNDTSMWGGITFRKQNPEDTAFDSGYTLFVRKNGEAVVIREPDFAVLYSGNVVLDEQGRIHLSISVNGENIVISQGANEEQLCEIIDYTFSEGYISFTGTGADVTFSDFQIYSYDGLENAKVSTQLVKDQGYLKTFHENLADWRIEGNASEENGTLYLKDGARAGLEGRVYTESEVNVTFNLDGVQTASNAADHWAGIMLGKETVYGDIWNFGGYLLIMRKTGTIDLYKNNGIVATTSLNRELTGDITARVVRNTDKIEVYLNDGQEPALSAEAPEYKEGFISICSDGGEVKFHSFAVKRNTAGEVSELLDDFSSDLNKWNKVNEPDRIEIVDGELQTKGVLVKQDEEQLIAGKGVSPDLVYTERTFNNVKIGFDVKLTEVALKEDWAGAYFHASGTEGFWKSGGYLLYLTNQKNLVLYKGGAIATATIDADPMKQKVHLEVEIVNGKIDVYVDYAAEPIISVKDKTFTTGYFGLCSDYADATFDNVTYRDLGEVELEEDIDKDIVWDEAYGDTFEESSDNWDIVNEACGTAKYRNGKLQLKGTSGADPVIYALKGRAYTSMEVSVDMTVPPEAKGWSAIAFGRAKWNDSIWSNGYFVFARFYASTGKAEINLYRTNVGIVGINEVDYTENTVLQVRLKVDGKDISVYVGENEEPIITYYANDYEGGTVALCNYCSDNAFDNFSIKSIKAPHEPDMTEWDVDFADDFSTEEDNWINVSDSYGYFEIENGSLHAVGLSGADPVLVALKNRAYRNMELSMDLTVPNADDGWAGVAFGRKNWDDRIWNSGYFVFARYRSSDKIAEITLFETGVGYVGDTPVAEIACNENDPFTLRIKVTDGKICLFSGENGELINTYQTEEYEGGYIALCTYNAQNRYDNFSIKVPEIQTAVAGVQISENSLSVVVGQSFILQANVLPSDASNQKVTWKSSEEKVASVTQDGTVQAVGAGETTITVTTEDGGFTDTCVVTVIDRDDETGGDVSGGDVSGGDVSDGDVSGGDIPEITAESIVLDFTERTVKKGDNFELKATVLPEGTETSLEWKSSDPSVAIVKDGVITAVNSGNAVITVTTVDGRLSAFCIVTVEQEETPIDPAEPAEPDDPVKPVEPADPIDPEESKVNKIAEELQNAGNVTITSEGRIVSEDVTYEIKDNTGNAVMVGGNRIVLNKKDGSGTVEVPVGEIVVKKISDAVLEAEVKEKGFIEAARSIVKNGLNVYQTKVDITVFDVIVPEDIKDNVDADNTVTVIFSIAGVRTGDHVKVFHRNESGVWEVLNGTVVADNKIAVTFSSFSPVIFINLSQTADNNSSNHNNNTSEEDSSENTVVEDQVEVSQIYVVVRGDTLSRVATRNGLTLRQLLAMNPQIKNPNMIYPGQEIVIGKILTDEATAQSLSVANMKYYQVKKGDSLYKIAMKNHVSLKDLLAINPKIGKQKYIYAGQTVRIR